MEAIQLSPFDTHEICFRLLSTGPACLALDGHRLGHGLPARQIPLLELRVLLQHPAAAGDLQRVVLEELVHRAMRQGEGWVVAVAGVLLPGLRRIAASVDGRVAGHVEADLLELVRDAIGQHASRAAELALGVLQFAVPCYPSSPRPMGRRDPLRA